MDNHLNRQFSFNMHDKNTVDIYYLQLRDLDRVV